MGPIQRTPSATNGIERQSVRRPPEGLPRPTSSVCLQTRSAALAYTILPLSEPLQTHPTET